MHIAPASRCFRERYGRGLPARQSVSGPKRHYFALYSQQEGVRTRRPQHPRESHVHVRHAPASPPLGIIIHLRCGVVGIIDLQGQNKKQNHLSENDMIRRQCEGNTIRRHEEEIDPIQLVGSLFIHSCTCCPSSSRVKSPRPPSSASSGGSKEGGSSVSRAGTRSVIMKHTFHFSWLPQRRGEINVVTLAIEPGNVSQ